MPHTNRIFWLAAVGALSAALLLSGCGRKGPLDPPPASVQQPGDANANPPTPPVEIGPDGRPIAPPGMKRHLPGDVLID